MGLRGWGEGLTPRFIHLRVEIEGLFGILGWCLEWKMGRRKFNSARWGRVEWELLSLSVVAAVLSQRFVHVIGENN